MDSKQADLLNRLEDLKKHQEEEEKLLRAQRRNQQALLTREQIKMYEMLGVNVSNVVEVDSGQIEDIESEDENEFEEVQEFHEEEREEALPSSSESSYVNNYNNELIKKDNAISPLKNIDEFQDSDAPQIKRPFLRRGSGLTNRFRIPPDAFNLKSLPPYKYTERINKTLAKKNSLKGPTIKEPDQPRKPVKKTQPAPTRKETQRLPSGDEPVEPETTELVVPKSAVLKPPAEPITSSISEPALEGWFNSKNQEREKQEEIHETPRLAKLPKGVSWAQVLNSNTTADSLTNIQNLLNITNESELDETTLFHLLEDRVNNLSLDASVLTVLKRLKTANKNVPDDEDRTLMNPEDPLIDDISSVSLQLEPHPENIGTKIIIDETTEESEGETDEDHRVRFADNVEVVEDATDLSTDIEAIELSKISTPNEKLNFQRFKRKVMGHKPSAESIEQRADLKRKSDQLKAKLMELELEISSARQQNDDLSRRREDFELDKIHFQNERDDVMEQLKDDRIKMEMQLHDERVKLDQEKQKFERMLKNPTKKEREEIAKLKETVDELKEELKVKEARHGSTSARYRSQIKQLEKENQSTKLELDVLKKENKKLEFENARLRKETNNKMLQEINKNIAKLAPQDDKKQPEVVKKLVTRKSEPILKKRTKSVPNVNVQSSSDSSSEDEQVKNRKFSKENHPVKVRRYDPVRAPATTSSADILAEMKREIENSDGSKDIWYPNGNLKKISPDGMLIRMLYFNKDIKETNINEGTVKYYYNETNTWHTTYIDGLEILEYPDGQVEHRFKDGTVEVHYENGSIRVTNSNWTDDTKEEWRLPDGTNIKIFNNESKILTFSNGQREIHTANHKRREYPDGTVKLAYEDGSFETRYSTGRIRIKDGKGNLISDTMAN